MITPYFINQKEGTWNGQGGADFGCNGEHLFSCLSGPHESLTPSLTSSWLLLLLLLGLISVIVVMVPRETGGSRCYNIGYGYYYVLKTQIRSLI